MEQGVCVFVCVSVWVKQTDGREDKKRTVRRGRGGEAENSTIHLAVVLVVILHPTGAENKEGLHVSFFFFFLSLCVCVCKCVCTCKENDNRTGQCAHSHAVKWGRVCTECVHLLLQDVCVCLCVHIYVTHMQFLLSDTNTAGTGTEN